MSDLEGFVLFTGKKTGYDPTIALTVGSTFVRMTDGALRVCGDPEFVNVFFDECGMRMMIKKAEKNMRNVFPSKNGLIKSNAVRNFLLALISVEAKTGMKIRFEGHNPHAQHTVIFDLSKYRDIGEKNG